MTNFQTYVLLKGLNCLKCVSGRINITSQNIVKWKDSLEGSNKAKCRELYVVLKSPASRENSKASLFPGRTSKMEKVSKSSIICMSVSNSVSELCVMISQIIPKERVICLSNKGSNILLSDPSGYMWYLNEDVNEGQTLFKNHYFFCLRTKNILHLFLLCILPW